MIYRLGIFIFFVSILFQCIFCNTNDVSDSFIDYKIVKKHPSLPFSKIEKDNKYGIKGKENILLPIEYDEIIFSSNTVQILKKDNKYGIYSFKEKKIVIPVIYKKIHKFKKGFAKLIESSKNSKNNLENATNSIENVGLINQEGEIIVKPNYQDIRPFQEGLAAVSLLNKWGFINTSNEIIIPCNYDKVSYFKYGYVRVKVGEFVGLIDKEGKKILPPIYDKISKKYKSNFNIIKVIKNGSKGWVGKKNNIFFEKIKKSKGKHSYIYLGKKLGVIDENNIVLISPQFEEIKYNSLFYFIQMKQNGKWGYISKEGEILIPAIFDRISNFKPNGKASVIYQKKMGFIDKKGKFTPALSN